MLRHCAFALIITLAIASGRAEAVTIRDVIELTKAGLSDQVLLALIEVDRGVFSVDAATVQQLKQAGVRDAVIVALIRSGRGRESEPAAAVAAPVAPAPVPEVVIVEHHDAPAVAAPIAVPYPVAVPVYVGVPTGRRTETITTTIQTDAGPMRARLPVPANCVKAEPVYWGFGGKLRPGSWEPPPTVVCR
ncbi:MAG: hypothetical protein ABIQ52_18550 [Vicinamibacterales bacterium]